MVDVGTGAIPLLHMEKPTLYRPGYYGERRCHDGARSSGVVFGVGDLR